MKAAAVLGMSEASVFACAARRSHEQVIVTLLELDASQVSGKVLL